MVYRRGIFLILSLSLVLSLLLDSSGALANSVSGTRGDRPSLEKGISLGSRSGKVFGRDDSPFKLGKKFELEKVKFEGEDESSVFYLYKAPKAPEVHKLKTPKINLDLKFREALENSKLSQEWELLLRDLEF